MTAVVTPAQTAGVLPLADFQAGEVDLAGAKAGSLSRAAAAGLPVLPGFVLTVPGTTDPAIAPSVREAWDELTDRGRLAMAVRSSSRSEDGALSSMAGQFASVLQVRGWPAFCDAVAEVLRSSGDRADMAVLVQPMLEPAAGGVLFGADPVSGRRDRLVVAAVVGGPHALVQGQVDGSRSVMTRRGRVLEREPGEGGYELDRHQHRALSRLARSAHHLFGGPQDIEWAIDSEGTLWLLQSRPITTLAPPAKGPVLGAGPVAETFPDPLSTLEQDLWVAPLRTGLEEALVLAGIASRRRMRDRPAVSVVGARAVADLDLLGLRPGRARWWSKLNPVPPARRLEAAWRVGRLRAALPALGRDIVGGTDALLADVPSLPGLPSTVLLGILRRSHQALVSLHGHEVLLGLLVPTGTVSGASVALQALASARAQELTDAETVAAEPVTLALVPPTLAPAPVLPPLSGRPPVVEEPDADEAALVREALRLRARWVQELTARAAWELGRRLATGGVLHEAGDVGLLSLDELTTLVNGGVRPDDLDDRHMCMPCAALPSAFRLGPDGEVVPVGRAGTPATGGVPAGGGRGSGPAHLGEGLPPEGAVLVVRHLQPQLASVLPRLAGLVSETGSPLSHLAILAREMNLPVVVGVPDAVSRFAHGTGLVVDGTTGEVSTVEAGE